jgi:antitoxin component YwqK of YwqJK toxin-antitoxin module
VFEGEWVDDRRNGQGILYMPDGSKFEGVWVNDILSGKVKLYDKDGKFKENATFKNNQKVS